jgi:hypothetical protein
MKINVLFWNLGNQPRDASIARMVAQHDTNILVLAENPINDADLLDTIDRRSGRRFEPTPSACKRVSVYVRGGLTLDAISESSRYSIRRLRSSNGNEILFVAAHLVSKRHWTGGSQTLDAAAFSASIRRTEEQVGHRRTVLVGDLNMNPFEEGVVGASALNAVMTRKIAEKMERTVQDERYAFFYNPMWSLYGDASVGPPGTHFYYRPEHVAYYWHMFDQVLIRPDLLHAFDNQELQILSHDGSQPLVRPDGRPNSRVGSDHLPIAFRLDLGRRN